MKYKITQNSNRHPELVSGSPHALAHLREPQDDSYLWTISIITLVLSLKKRDTFSGKAVIAISSVKSKEVHYLLFLYWNTPHMLLRQC